MTPVEKIAKAKQYIELGNELMKQAIVELSENKPTKKASTSLEAKQEKMLKKFRSWK